MDYSTGDELALLATAIGIMIARDRSNEEINLLGNLLTLTADTLFTISSAPDRLGQQSEQNSE